MAAVATAAGRQGDGEEGGDAGTSGSGVALCEGVGAGDAEVVGVPDGVGGRTASVCSDGVGDADGSGVAGGLVMPSGLPSGTGPTSSVGEADGSGSPEGEGVGVSAAGEGGVDGDACAVE